LQPNQKIMLHQLNIFVHIVAGTLALIVGIITILKNRNIPAHRRWGTLFNYLLVVVVGTGFIGFLFFRQEPFFLMLTLISGYVGFAGFRNIQLKEKRATRIDALAASGCLVIAIIYGVYVIQAGAASNATVIYATLGALVLVTGYDLIKYFFYHRYLKKAWLYEHIYKMISACSALASAFAGNVFRDYHPYSQLGPSVAGTLLILYFIWQRSTRKPLIQM